MARSHYYIDDQWFRNPRQRQSETSRALRRRARTLPVGKLRAETFRRLNSSLYSLNQDADSVQSDSSALVH